MNRAPNLRTTAEYRAMDAAHHWHPFTDTKALNARDPERLQPGDEPGDPGLAVRHPERFLPRAGRDMDVEPGFTDVDPSMD